MSLGKTLAIPPNPTKLPLSSFEKIKLKSQALKEKKKKASSSAGTS